MNQPSPEPAEQSSLSHQTGAQISPASETALGRMPQLDGLRALAVGAVFWHHLVSPRYIFGTSLGSLGVYLFYVISGFLISGLLFDARSRGEEGPLKRFALRQFYIRRFLRIFPLYYLTLALGVMLNVPAFRDTWLWNAAYLTNVSMWFTRELHEYTNHFWSLAVEEQFYLCWPFLLLFTPRKLLCPCILLFLGAAPLWRLSVYFWAKNPDIASWALLPATLDYLCVGALFAYVARHPALIPPHRLARILLVVGICIYFIFPASGILSVCRRTGIAFGFGALVWTSARGFSGPFGKFLQWGPIAYLGKISYGIYVIHIFAPAIWRWLLYAAPVPGYRVFQRLHLPAEVYADPIFTNIMVAAVNILLAALSWHLYESPLNNLKRYFPYSRTGSPALPNAAA